MKTCDNRSSQGHLCGLKKRHTGRHRVDADGLQITWQWSRHQACHLLSKRITYKRPGEYDADDPMYVVGCIDSNGAITARVVAGGGDVMHTKDESRGRRWRWNIWAQEFNATRNPTLDHLTTEEFEIVNNWLVEHGHKRPDDV